MNYTNRVLLVLLSTLLIGLIIGCAPDNEGGFEDTTAFVNVEPATIATGLNFPWGLDFVNNTNNDGIGEGSVIAPGNLLVAQRGSVGNRANSIVQVDPHSGAVSTYTDGAKKDFEGVPAVDRPFDVAFEGPFAWVANDSQGLGSIAVTDPNPAKAPNGPTGAVGEPVTGPTGAGVFESDDFGFIVLSVTPESGSTGVSTVTEIEVQLFFCFKRRIDRKLR